VVSTRLDRAIARIDARNSDDPNRILIRGVEQPKEQTHAGLVTAWVSRLVAEPSEELLLASRAHHIRRWTIARDSHPDGRIGYLAWRRALQDMHASELAAIMDAEGYPPEAIQRAGEIIRKRGLARDADVQALEDALCLVFLETQFQDLARKLDEPKMIDVLRKTMKKMSPQGIQFALELGLEPPQRSLLLRAAATNETL